MADDTGKTSGDAGSNNAPKNSSDTLITFETGDLAPASPPAAAPKAAAPASAPVKKEAPPVNAPKVAQREMKATPSAPPPPQPKKAAPEPTTVTADDVGLALPKKSAAPATVSKPAAPVVEPPKPPQKPEPPPLPRSTVMPKDPSEAKPAPKVSQIPPAPNTTPLPPITPIANAPQVSEEKGSVSKTPFRDDIDKILKEIQLPERRTPASGPSVGTTRNAATERFANPNAEPEPTIVSEVTKPGKSKTAASTQKAAPAVAPSMLKFEEADAQQLPEPEPEKPVVTPIRTLKEDLQSVVREKKISIVRAVALEEEKKRDRKLQPTAAEIATRTQRSRRTFAVVFAIGVLLFLGAAALFGVYTIEKQRTGQIYVPDDRSVLFAEQSVVFPLDGVSPQDIRRTLAQARAGSTGTLGSITQIVPTLKQTIDEQESQRLATTAEFLTAIGARVSDELLRALESEFFLGIHTVDKNAPLIVIPVRSYDHAFAGMLAWEKTMNADLAPAFTPVAALMASETGLPVSRPFQDLVMRNYDARALKDDTDTVQLYYSFPTPHILVIAESPYSFTEILSRLQAQRKL